MIEIYRSSRIETLADLLAVQMRAALPLSVLTPQRVIVGHLGMKRWLTQYLAQMRLPGLPRVAANLDMLLPSEWLDGLAQQVLGSEAIAIAPYRRTALRWRIYQLLADLPAPQVQRYLHGADAPRRRYQLADRLAGLYGQYLVYRCDWLRDWEQGKSPDEHWQGELWRRLVADIGLAHRGQRMRELAARLPALLTDPEQPALHVFGVSHLPPDALYALEALSQTRTVCLYFPDPCRELWDDLRDQRSIYQEQLDGGAFLSIGHPLLAALGRMGQHFCLLLNGLDSGCDLRDQYDEMANDLLPPTASLLQRLQHSVRTRRPDWLARNPLDARDPRLDATLRVHACHTRLRELEVLKDALLDQLAADPSLHPRHIVVMAPNMALYAPLLPVVFADPATAALLPYQLADVALVRTHPLLSAVRELLDLPTQRISRSQVLALLALPAVARRFALSEQRHAALQRWLDRSHVAWGLDGEMKADFGAAPVDDHSFAFGVDRMMAGFLLGRSDAHTLIDERILPANPVAGPDVECLGALCALLAILREWRGQAQQVQSLTQWSAQIRDWFERLFSIDSNDEAEREAHTAVMKLAARLADESRAAGVDVDVDWTVVREVLKQGLDGIPERQVFLAGGITFCGMVPQRAIPFAVIALLGLNDGDYPRPRPDTGLDLMQSKPRLGDRDNRSDDRYLFLEALMSARSALHLSYLGEGAQDGKPRNPALPLAELLGFLDQQHESNSAASDYDPPWRVRHALQPFDARYFDPHNANRGNSDAANPRMFSYSASFAHVHSDPNASEWRFMRNAPALERASSANVELRNVIAFFGDPARWLCKNALRLSRDALENQAPNDSEPLGTDIHYFDTLRTDLVWTALQNGAQQLPVEPPVYIRRSGRYASGELGRRTWQHLRIEAQAFLDLAITLPPFSGGSAIATPVAIDLHIDDLRLLGSIGRMYRAGDELWLVAMISSGMSFKPLTALFLQWAALRLSLPNQVCRYALIHKNNKGEAAMEPAITFSEDLAQLQNGLLTLMTRYRQAEKTAGTYYAKSSYAYALTMHDGQFQKAPDHASRRWFGPTVTDTPGERDYAPYYNLMLAGDESFIQFGTEENARFTAIATELLQAMTGAAPTP